MNCSETQIHFVPTRNHSYKHFSCLLPIISFRINEKSDFKWLLFSLIKKMSLDNSWNNNGENNKNTNIVTTNKQ